jgi:outer membrane protein assembly factor BamB
MALDMQNGTTQWTQSDLQYRNLTSPVLFDGYLVVGDAEGYLHWLNSDDGRFVAQSKVDSSGLQATPVVAGGKLLIQARNGEVYAYTR